MTTDLECTKREATPGSIDRRSALKKAAAAGAVAWAAPVLLGTSQAAAAACTPKCIPTAFGALQFTFVRQCGTNNRNSGKKWIRVTVDLASGGACPCGTTPSGHLTVTAGQFYDTNSSGSCTGGDALTTYTSQITSPVLASNQFVLAKTGAIGNGCIYGCVRVTSKCLDRDGTAVYRTCTYQVSFNTGPGGGSCGSAFTGVTVDATLTSCQTLCSTPPTACGTA